MNRLTQGKQSIGQLEPKRGAYFYLRIARQEVERYPRKNKTRLICAIADLDGYRCGLNHMGDGDYFVIVAKKLLEQAGLSLGDEVEYIIYEDPDPLGVAVPEVLEALLAQDEDLKTMYHELTDGKKRSLIFSIHKVKDIDLQVKKVYAFFG